MPVTQISDNLELSELERFVENGKSENQELEFKEKSYGRTDDQVKEFLKDVTALANNSGGFIVLGIRELDGVAGAITPLTDINVDEEILRYQNLLRDCVEPSIFGVNMYSLVASGGHVLIIKVPRSPSSPHRISYRKTKLFYIRTSNSVTEMDVSQLRQAFLNSHTAHDTALKLSVRRAQMAIDDISASGHSAEGIVVLQIIPIGGIVSGLSISVNDLSAHQAKFRPLLSTGYNNRINIDGIQNYNESSGFVTQTQLFRDGSVLSICDNIVFQPESSRQFLGPRICSELHQVFPMFFNGLRLLGALPPIYVRLEFRGVRGTTMETGGQHSFFSDGTPKLFRNELVLPTLLIDDFSSTGTYDIYLQQLMDPLWNAYNRHKCPRFDDEGNWLA